MIYIYIYIDQYKFKSTAKQNASISLHHITCSSLMNASSSFFADRSPQLKEMELDQLHYLVALRQLYGLLQNIGNGLQNKSSQNVGLVHFILICTCFFSHLIIIILFFFWVYMHIYTYYSWVRMHDSC